MTGEFSFFKLELFAVLALVCLWISIAHASEVQVHVMESSQAKILSSGSSPESLRSLEPGQATSLDLTTPIEIISANRIPLILFPVYGSHSSITLDPPRLQDVVTRLTDQRLDQLLSIVMGRLSDIQALISQKKYADAAEDLKRLETDHPQARFLEFTRASLLLLQGKRDEALKVAELASLALPDYREGREFIRKLRANASSHSGGGNP